MSNPDEQLIDDWIDGCQSDIDQQRLEDWLNQSPDHMRRFVEANIRNQMLQDVVQTEMTAEQVLRDVPTTSVNTARTLHSVGQRRIRRWMTVATIATTLVLAVFLSPPRDEGVVLDVVASNDAVIDGINGTPGVGDQFTLNRFWLQSGSIEVLLDSGVRVELIAPVEAEFISDMRLHLVAGRVSADVGDRGKGFTVVTDAGEVVDLGTRFGVEADGDGEARVAVFSGAVEFHPRNATADDEVVTLTEGEALMFSARAGLRRWQQVAMAVERAGLSRMSRSRVISDVYDNLGEGDLRPFYGVIAGGMKPGALAFTDKPNPVWSNVPGNSFPPELLGADLVRTYHRFRNKKSYELTLSLSAPADVYVLLVTPCVPPKWLSNGFELTESRLRSGTWHKGLASHPATIGAPDGNYLEFTVWKCAAGPGELKLGVPRDEGESEVEALMYGVAVKARNE